MNKKSKTRLPDDIIYEILVMLQVKDLMRFKSVSKHWASMIKSSRFISSHLENSPTDKLMVLSKRNSFISQLDLTLKTQTKFKLRNEFGEVADRDFDIISSFHGIVCLEHLFHGDQYSHRGLYSVISLWNPATRDVKVLPPPLLVEVEDDDFSFIHYGFGFHVQSNDYRVVRVLQDQDGPDYFRSRAEVYSLNSDSWTIISARIPMTTWILRNSPGPIGDGGTYFWLAQGRAHLLSFDFSNQQFEAFIPPLENPSPEPEELTPEPLYFPHSHMISIHDQRLAYIHPVRDGYYDIWVLNRSPLTVSWTKLHSTRHEVPHHLSPIGFSGDGRMVLSHGDDVLYLSNDDISGFHSTHFDGEFHEAAVYKESMVSIEGANGITYKLDREWKTDSTAWNLLLSETILAKVELAHILDQNARSLVIFDKPKIVPQFPRQISEWSAHQAGYIKINTDAVWKSSTRLGSYGWIARDDSGVVLKAACSNPFPMHSIIVGQAEAVRDALRFAAEAGWGKIIIDLDWRSLVDILNDPLEVKILDPRVVSIIDDIGDRKGDFEDIKFVFVPISKNLVAHCLALHGFSRDERCIWSFVTEDNEMPDWLRNALARARRDHLD